MQQVWVLSQEAPFDDWEEAGGCVCGVYATREAALCALLTILGEEEAAAIQWTQYHETHWRGETDPGSEDSTALYVLTAYEVQEEISIRAAYEHELSTLLRKQSLP